MNRTSGKPVFYRITCLTLALAFALAGKASWATPAETSLVSAPNGSDVPLATGTSLVQQSAVSSDGRYVVFQSEASGLVQGDTNGLIDVFVRDRLTNTTKRVSKASSGAQSNGFSGEPSISANGRRVVFRSTADNLVVGDTNHTYDLFVRDLVTNSTTRVNVASNGAQDNSGGLGGSISADGRYVAFYSDGTNLVPGDTNRTIDVFVRDLLTKTTERVSVRSNGSQHPYTSQSAAISGDGRYVAFYTTRLTPDSDQSSSELYVRDRLLKTTKRVAAISRTGSGGDFPPSFSADGRYLAFDSRIDNLVAGDTNNASDVFVRDLTTSTITRVSVASSGVQGTGGDGSFMPSISADGRYVAFASSATNLVGGDTNKSEDIFVRDIVANATMRVSISSAGAQSNFHSEFPSISADGRYVVFPSQGSNLVAGDINNGYDVFVHEVGTFSFDFWLKSHLLPGGCKSVIGTVTLQDRAPPGGVVVALSSTLAAATIPATVQIVAGAKSKNVVVNTQAVALDESGFVNATVAGVTKGQDLTVRRIGLSSLTMPSKVVGGNTVAGSAMLECNAAPGPIKVEFNSSNPALVHAEPASLMVPVGTQSAAFNLATSPVQAVNGASISGTANGIRRDQGIRVDPAASITPTILKFGSHSVNTTSPALSVTLLNKGPVSYSVISFRLAGNTPERFAQTNDCPASLDGGASCTIRVTFRPTVVGYRSARLDIATSAGSFGVPLSGTGF